MIDFKKLTLAKLEELLKSGEIKLEYLDSLKSYVGVWYKGKYDGDFLMPGSVIDRMANFWLQRLKSKKQEERTEAATELQNLCHYRWQKLKTP